MRSARPPILTNVCELTCIHCTDRISALHPQKGYILGVSIPNSSLIQSMNFLWCRKLHSTGNNHEEHQPDEKNPGSSVWKAFRTSKDAIWIQGTLFPRCLQPFWVLPSIHFLLSAEWNVWTDCTTESAPKYWVQQPTSPCIPSEAKGPSSLS